MSFSVEKSARFEFRWNRKYKVSDPKLIAIVSRRDPKKSHPVKFVTN
jgi:hypothetical protein